MAVTVECPYVHSHISTSIPAVEKRLESYILSTIVPHLGGLVVPPREKEGQKELEDAAGKTPTNAAPTGTATGKGESPPAEDPSKEKSPPAKVPSKGKSPPAKGNSSIPHPDELGEAKGKLKPTQVSGMPQHWGGLCDALHWHHYGYQLKVEKDYQWCVRKLLCCN